MNRLYDNDLQDLNENDGQDHEISLGTTTILGIFFALALLCAVFFGFGYSLGRRPASSSVVSEQMTKTSESSNSKPAPGSPANQTAAPTPYRQTADTAQSAVVAVDSPNTVPDSQPVVGSESVKAVVSTPATNTVTKPVAIVPPATVLSGSSVVQVAAMSHQEDADVVAVDLKRRGYTVAIRREPQDKLFHVQIGPFANRKEADTMRQHLQTDGYNNAIVK